MKRKIMIIICVALVILLVLWLAAGFYFYSLTLPRSLSEPFHLEVTGEPKDDNARQLAEWGSKSNPANVYITSRDGLKLAGTTFTLDDGGDRWVILVHGYALGKEFMYYAAQHFYEWGINVLTVDLRGHGESEGKNIGMGWLDRFDLVDWAEWLESEHPGCVTELFGISMGAAAVTCASGEALPPSVKAIVADCGYTSAADEFAYQVKHMYNIPPRLIMPSFAFAARVMAGYSVYDASPLKQLQKGGDLPILFAHGEEDDFVPYYMMKPLVEAAGDRADIIIVRSAKHGESAFWEPGKYWAKVRSFTFKHLK